MSTLSSVRTNLKITVGTALGAFEPRDAILDNLTLDTSRELNLLKAALLYADNVIFCSMGPSALISIMNRPAHLSEDEKLNWFLDFYKNLGFEPNIQKILTFIDEYKIARQRKRQNFQAYMNYKKAFTRSLDQLDQMAEKGGIKELNAIFKLEGVEFKNFGIFRTAEDFIDEISKVLTMGNSYPLLDEGTGNLIDLAIQAGHVKPLGLSVNKARQVGLSSNFFTRLPLFDQASVAEIVDIRKELNSPLIRFRSAIVSFAKDVESTPWGKGFEPEAEQIFIERVEPAILEIEEEYRTNSGMIEILSRSITSPGAVATSALGIAVSKSSQFPEVVTALSVAAGLTVGALDAIKERRKKNEEIAKNQIYFYYRASKLLSK